MTVAAVSIFAESTKPTTPTAAPTTPHLTTKPVETCPSASELEKVGCLCYKDEQYLICDGSKGTLSFEKKYALKTLVIRNSPNLPFWSEHITQSDDLTVESLIVLQGNKDVIVNENFNDLLQLPSKTIKIVTDGQIKTLDLSRMRNDLTAVSVTGVPKLVHGAFSSFNFGEESILESLRLRNVSFEPVLENFVLNGLPLKVVEVTNSNLKGSVSVVPSQCPPEDERIVIDLRNNPGLTGFGFADLFQKETLSACHYHIDLSDNPNLDSKILNKNVDTLKAHGDHMFIHLAGKELDCSCDLYKLYNSTLRNKIHSVKCSNGIGYLDQIVPKSEIEKKVCP